MGVSCLFPAAWSPCVAWRQRSILNPPCSAYQVNGPAPPSGMVQVHRQVHHCGAATAFSVITCVIWTRAEGTQGKGRPNEFARTPAAKQVCGVVLAPKALMDVCQGVASRMYCLHTSAHCVRTTSSTLARTSARLRGLVNHTLSPPCTLGCTARHAWSACQPRRGSTTGQGANYWTVPRASKGPKSSQASPSRQGHSQLGLHYLPAAGAAGLSKLPQQQVGWPCEQAPNPNPSTQLPLVRAAAAFPSFPLP